jgi:hypothetical protein
LTNFNPILAYPEDVNITSINAPYVVISEMLDDISSKFIVGFIKDFLKANDYTTFITKPANQLIWGYEDPILKYVNKYLPEMVKSPNFGYFLGKG